MDFGMVGQLVGAGAAACRQVVVVVVVVSLALAEALATNSDTSTRRITSPGCSEGTPNMCYNCSSDIWC